MAAHPRPERLAEWSYRQTPTALVKTDPSGLILECNPAFGAACNESITSLIGRPIFDALRQPPKSRLVAAYGDVLATGAARVVVSIGGDVVPGQERQWDFRLEHDQALEVVYALGTDLTRESRLSAELRARTISDRLTGLPNRDAFVDELDTVLSTGQPVALFIVDVDHFTLINDTYGHEFGDAVLLMLSRRLSRVAGVRNTVARIGGDQFAVMMKRLSDPSQVWEVSGRMRQALTEEMTINRTSVHLRLSIGFSVSGEETKKAADLLREADTALSRAAELGGENTQEFRPEFHLEMQKRIRTEADLRLALGTSQLDADIQGIFRVGSGELIGFEALARWRHPVRGTVPPVDFIEVADQHGLLDHVFRAVLDRSLSHLTPWLTANRERCLAVNVAPSQLADGRVAATVAAAIEMSGIAASQLVIEVTERQLVADPTSIATVKDLHALGARIAIDDFGAGASSLGYLWTLPVSILKLDRSLTASILTDPGARLIVSSLVQLTRDLGLRTVAEGVEVDDELTALVELGCTHVQGYLLHRPCRLDDVGDLIDVEDGHRQLLVRPS